MLRRLLSPRVLFFYSSWISACCIIYIFQVKHQNNEYKRARKCSLAEGGELLRATSRSIITHFCYYTICINVLETSTKTNCSLVQREEHSNVCKTLQAAIRDGLPGTTCGFSDLSWHRGRHSAAPSLRGGPGSPPACPGRGTAPSPARTELGAASAFSG